MGSEFNNSRAESYPFNIILSYISLLASILTIILCVLILVAVLKKGWKNLDYNMKILMMAIIFDLAESIIVLYNSINGLLNTEQYLKSELGCRLIFVLLVVFSIASINFTSIVALDRYLIVVAGIRLERKYLYLVISLFCSLNGLSIFIGWYLNGIGLLPSTIVCFLKFDNFGGLLSQGLVILSIALSTTLIFFCYIKIIIHRSKQLKEICELCPNKYNSITRQRYMIIIKSGSLILASTISNVPYCIMTLTIMIKPSIYTPLIDTIRCTLITLNMITNSLLLLSMRSDITSQFKSLIGFKSEKELSNNSNIDIEII